MAAVEIRNAESKRVFDVNVDEEGKILNYEVKQGKVRVKISEEEVKNQIDEILKKEKK